MSTFKIRPAESTDLEAVLALNESELPHVSQISMADLEELAELACHFKVLEDKKGIAGFLLAMDEKADYDSLNFQWFKARYLAFTYIDRIVVDARCRSKGCGRMLYEDIDAFARARSGLITCEVNIRPPNPGSMEFHKKMGFAEVGTQDTEGGKKTVSLLLKDLCS